MGINEGDKNMIKFNVGGRLFETTATTLANAGRDSYFGALLDENWNLRHDSAGVHFIDRSPECFAILLDLLRTNDLSSSSTTLYREAAFYGLLPLVRAAKWGPFDPDRLRRTASVASPAPGDGTALRASPSGGCCVAHGCVVHVYDWTMEHRPALHLHHRRVNDAAWADDATVAVSVCERPSSWGSIGLFSAATGHLRHALEVNHAGERKSFAAGALAFDHALSLYASCRGRSDEYGVGVWDTPTGLQKDFVYEPPGWPLGDADRLQTVPYRPQCLMAATLFPRRDDCYVSLLDLRERRVVWRWSDAGPASTIDERRVRDAVAGEDGNSVCVVNEFEDLGFIDLRASGSGVRWCSRSRLMTTTSATKRKAVVEEEEEPCYPKLACSGGRLFSSINDSISVFSGPEWVLTSRLRRTPGGSICDFSIGGDRLFALHSEDNVFDIWEAPPPAAW